MSPLTVLINSCLGQGIFPDVLKITKVLPIYKKGKKEDIGNYRPAAIVPVLSKIVELVVGTQLMKYLESHDLICKQQFGFRKGLSTTQAIISLVDKVLDCFEKKDFAAITFCDLSKAFDRVSHTVLLEKLKHYNIKGVALDLFRSYLQNRSQYVALGNNLSQCKPVTCGVPQGSVLGPLLFLIVVNDLSVNVPTDIVLYADDTTVITRSSDYSQLLENCELNKNVVENWLTANNLILNKDKTSTVVFSLREIPEMPNENLHPKFLGLTFDTTLNWQYHVHLVKARLSSSIFAMKCLCGELNQNSLIQAYYGLFHSHLRYGLIVWGSSPHANEVFIMQKKVLRVIAGVNMCHSCKNLFKEFKILTLFSLFIQQCLLYIRANIHLLDCRKDVHSYNTRFCNNINLPKVRLAKTDKRPMMIAIKLYNKLPLDIRLLSDKDFKIKLNYFLCKGSFYSIEEYMSRQWTVKDFC